MGDGPDAGDGPGIDIAAIPTDCTHDRADDRPDDSTYDQIRVVYVVPADLADSQYDTSGRICNSIRAFATWFHAQSGGYLRFDTSGGVVDIGFVRLGKSDVEMRGDDVSNSTIDHGIAFVRERVERELGQLAPNKLYAVFYDGTSSYACGGGAWPPTIDGRVG